MTNKFMGKFEWITNKHTLTYTYITHKYVAIAKDDAIFNRTKSVRPFLFTAAAQRQIKYIYNKRISAMHKC